jgi:phospholipid/cholesterol/gamma-HCH transport system substrate-binding protein
MNVANVRLKLAGLIAFACLAAVIFVQLFGAAGGHSPLRGEQYTVSALVPQAFNLVPRSDVRAAGVKIGEVTALNEDGQVSKVDMEIDKDQAPLYADATVRVRTKTLVGETYLDVDPGTRKSGDLRPGATLPLQAAKQAVALEDILDTLDPATRREVRRNMAGLGGGLDGNGQQLNDIFGAVKPTAVDGGRLMEVLRPQRQELAALVGQTGSVLDAFAVRSGQVRSLAVDAKSTAVAVAARDGKFRESLAVLPATLTQAQESVARLGRFARSSTPVVRNLSRASVDLAPAVRDLQPAARDTRTLFRELTPFLKAVDPVVDRLAPAAKSLQTVVPPLDAVLRQVLPAVGYLKPFAPETASFFSNVGAVVTARDSIGSIIRVQAMLGPDQLVNTPEALKKAEKALIAAGGLTKVFNVRANSYPKAGTAGEPTDETEFGSKYPQLTRAP